MPKKKKYTEWTLIDWDGNPELNLKCWRKSFHNGHVSIGVGEFDMICYSYGANSDYSISGTRSRSAYGRPDQTEDEAKAMVDRNNGRCERNNDDISEHDKKALELAKKLSIGIRSALDEGGATLDSVTFDMANIIRDEMGCQTDEPRLFRYACRLIVLLEASRR